MSKTAHPAPSRTRLADIAADIIDLHDSRDRSFWAAGVLEVLRELDRHHDTADARRDLADILAALERPDVMITLPFPEIFMVPIAVMHQRAVGHGGFHTGAYGLTEPSIRWVYDCGSLRETGRDRLSEEICKLAGAGPQKRTIDFLFLSHFDRDHINGVKELTSALNVTTAVLPHLTDLDRLGVLVDAIMEDADAANDQPLIDAVMDPATWLREQGATRVVQIRPDSGEGRSRVFDPEIDPDVAVPERLHLGQPVFVPQTLGVDRDDTAAAEVGVGSGWILADGINRLGDWCLVPHVTPVTPAAREALRVSVEALLARDPAKETLIDAFRRKLSDKTFIADLKAAYKLHELGDANAISMSLYAGPRRASRYLATREPVRTYLDLHDAGPGWLLTGDAKLAQPKRRAQWKRFYSAVRQHVGALMLPHHGSHLNFHEDILDAAREDAVIFACRREKAGNPLQDDVWPHVEHRRYRTVSDKPESMLVQVSGSSVLSSEGWALRELADHWR